MTFQPGRLTSPASIALHRVAVNKLGPPVEQKQLGRQLVGLAQVGLGVLRHQVPQVVVAPERKSNDVVHRKIGLQALV